MKNTVLFLIDSLEAFGGAEKNLLTVARSLSQDKYKIIVCCLKGGAVCKEFQKQGIALIDLKVKRIYDFNALLKAVKIIQLIKKENVKILVTYFESSDFWGSIAARIAGVPVLISNRRDTGFKLKKRHIFAYRLIDWLFDRIIAVSDEVKRTVIKNERAKPEQIVTIYNGVEDYHNNGKDRSALRKELGLDQDKFTVTMVANFSPIKGHKDFLFAASEIIKENKSVQFLLVGEDKKGYLNELKLLISYLGIEHNVIFSGFRRDISEILAISDIAVLSSITEGFSNAILEYMAAGMPVVATDVGGNGELIIEGKTGFLVSANNPSAMADAITRLINDKPLRKIMSENGRARVRDYFSQDAMVRNIDALFEDTLNQKDLK